MFKSMKKDELKAFMKKYHGFKDNELSGTKDVLLRKLLCEPPSVTFLIDSRECLQRILVIFLDKIGYDDTHLFNVKAPLMSATGSAMDPLDAPFGGDCGSASLEDSYLNVGNWIHFEYDFGSTSIIKMHVDDIENRDSVLPEEIFLYNHPTRAQILSVNNLHHVAPQYG